MNTKCLFSLATLLLFLGQTSTAAGLTSFELHNIDKVKDLWNGSGVKIGVVDTKFNVDHPLLKDQFIDVFNNSSYTGDKPYHGNHVSGIAAGNTTDGKNYGIAPKAKILGYGNMGRGVTDAEFQELVNQGIKIVNHSHTGESTTIQRIAKQNDVLMVYSAGNDGDIITDKQHGIGSKGSGGYYDIGAWLVVGNVNQNEMTRKDDGTLQAGGKAFGGDTPYSNLCNGAQGYCVFAAGTQILSADYTSGFVEKTGTSMSAPAVTGITALVAQKYSFLGGKQLADIILSTANSNIDMPKVIYKKLKDDNVYYVIYVGDGDLVPKDSQGNFDKTQILKDLKDVYSDFKDEYLNNTGYVTLTKEQIFGQGIVDAEKALKGLALLDVNRMSTNDVENGVAYYTIDTQGKDATFENDIAQRKYDAKYHQDKTLRKSLDGKDAGFKKTGLGTLTLSGDLKYLGDTIVDGGEIKLAGTSGTTKQVASGFQVKSGANLTVGIESNIAKNLDNAGTTDINKKTTIGQDLTNKNGGTLNVNAETTVNQTFTNAGTANINQKTDITQNFDNSGTANIKAETTVGQTLSNQTSGNLDIQKGTTITAGNFTNAGTVNTSDTLTISVGNFDNAGTATLNGETNIVAGSFSNSGTVDLKGTTTVAQTLTNQNNGTLNVNAETTARNFNNNGEANLQGKTTISNALTNGGTLNVDAETSANSLDNSGTANIKGKTTANTLTNQSNGILTIGTAPTARARLLQNRNATTPLLNVGQNLENAGTTNIFESTTIGGTLGNSGTLNIDAETTASTLENSGETNIFATTNITNDFQNLANGTANIAGATTIGATFSNFGTTNITAATQTNALTNSGIVNIKATTNITNNLENQSGGFLTIGEAKTTTTPTARSAMFRNSAALATIGNNLNNAGTATINAKTTVANNLNNQSGGTLNINAETTTGNLTNEGTTNIDAVTNIQNNLDNQGTLKVGITTPQNVTVGGQYKQGSNATLQLAFSLGDTQATNSKIEAADYSIGGGTLLYAPLSASNIDRTVYFDLGTLGNHLGSFRNIALLSNGNVRYSLTADGRAITANFDPNLYANFANANASLARVLRAMANANVSADYKTFFETLNASDFATYRSALVDLNDLSHLQYNNLLLGIQNQDILEKIVNLQTEAEGVFLRPRYAHLKAGLKAHRAGFEFYANKNTTLGGLSAFINYDNLSGSDVSSQLVSFGTGLRNTTAAPVGIFGGVRLGFANNTVKKTQQLKYKTRSASLFAGIDKDFAVGSAHLIPTFYVDYHYFHQEKFHHAGISYRGTPFFNSLQANNADYSGNNLFARNVHAKNSNFVSANLGLTFKQNLADFWNLGIHGFYERRLLGDKFKSTARFTDFGNDFEQTLKLSQNFFRLGFDLNYESPINANGIGYFASVGVDYEISEGGADKYRAYGADLKGGLKF